MMGISEQLEHTRIDIIIHSMFGHILELAEAVRAGAEQIAGVQARIFRVQETLSPEILQKMGARVPDHLPVATVEQLTAADGLMFGIPYGRGLIIRT